MKILADENIDYPIIKHLRAEGFEIVSIIEDNRGIDDKNVLAVANQIRAILLTNDKDFGELVIRHRLPHHGIVLLRLNNSDLLKTAEIILNVLNRYGEKLATQFTVVREKDVKVRLLE
jgi:predicted nuclease of predicted toxin-antitoxin system